VETDTCPTLASCYCVDIIALDRVGSYLFIFSESTEARPCHSRSRKKRIHSTFSPRRHGPLCYIDFRIQVLQMVAWFSRGVTSLLLASSWYKPNLDYLHLSASVSWTSRLYFSLSLVLELIVRFFILNGLRYADYPRM